MIQLLNSLEFTLSEPSALSLFAKRFPEYVRPLTQPVTDAVFTTANGKKLSSSDVNRDIKALWKLVFSINAPSINTRIIIYKMMVTETRKAGASREERMAIANLMLHDIATADQHYGMNMDLHASQQACSFIRSCVYGLNDESESEANETDTNDESDEEDEEEEQTTATPKTTSTAATPETSRSGQGKQQKRLNNHGSRSAQRGGQRNFFQRYHWDNRAQSLY